MRTWVRGGLRFFLVTVGIVAFTSLGIDATDMLRGSQSALGILADRATSGQCPADMVRVDGSEGPFCIDMFEASVGRECVAASPRSITDTARNVNALECAPESIAGKDPWTFVAVHQAKALCAKAGKRLPSAREWYEAALGTVDDGRSCVTSGPVAQTGMQAACRSGAGAADLIGNVWEFVDVTVTDGQAGEWSLPDSGYVAAVDAAGLAIQTTSTPQVAYNNDYFWMRPEGTFAVMRGGFHAAADDAGIYSTYAQLESETVGGAIGFRCAMSLPG